MAAMRGGDVEIGVAIERQTLRAPEAAIENMHVASLRDAVNAIVAGSSRPGDVQIAARMKCQMIRGKRRLQRGEHKNFAAGADFENRAAAIADVKIFRVIEGDARGDAHAFNPLLGAAIRRDAVNGAVVAAGDEEVTVAIEGQPGGIDQRSDERLDAVIRSDFVKGNGNALAARPAKGHVDISVGVDRWVGDWMKIVRDLHGDGNRMWLAFALRRGYAHRAAVG